MVGGMFTLPRCQSVTPDEYHALAAIVRPDRVRRRRPRASRPRSRHALRRVHDPSPQRVLDVRQRAERPHHHALAVRTRHRARRRRRVPCRGPARRLLLLALRLASPRLPAVPRGAQAVLPRRSRRRARATSRPIASARTCSGSCASCSRTTGRSTCSGSTGSGSDRRDWWRRRRDRRARPRVAARHPHQRPAPRPRRLPHARAVRARRPRPASAGRRASR